jgi:hypothetical protein
MYGVIPSFGDKSVTERAASSTFLVLDSANRDQNASSAPIESTGQSWNNFRVQRPQQLLGAFARRIEVAEVRFPWFIPNIIEGFNNEIYFWVGVPIPGFTRAPGEPYFKTKRNGLTLAANTWTETVITLETRFYLPSELVSALNTGLTTAGISAAFSYNAREQQYTLTNNSATDFLTVALGAGSEPETNSAFATLAQYANSPSLFKTLGFQVIQDNNAFLDTTGTGLNTLTGLATNSSYTDYVDILSDKITNYVKVKDGSSSNFSSGSMICRVFANNEISIPTMDATTTYPVTCRPFPIYRKFVCPKQIRWNPDATVDWLDVRVVDMYGDPVPVPLTSYVDNDLVLQEVEGSYPDFQITLLCSED